METTACTCWGISGCTVNKRSWTNFCTLQFTLQAPPAASSGHPVMDMLLQGGCTTNNPHLIKWVPGFGRGSLLSQNTSTVHQIHCKSNYPTNLTNDLAEEGSLVS